MGWLSTLLKEDPAHEGWVTGTSTALDLTVAVEDDPWPDEDVVELAYGDEPCEIRWVRAACECGWRSGWTLVPGAEWVRYAVLVPEVISDAISLAWNEHVKNVIAWRDVEHWEELPALLGVGGSASPLPVWAARGAG